jgi:hypothetical protein
MADGREERNKHSKNRIGGSTVAGYYGAENQGLLGW